MNPSLRLARSLVGCYAALSALAVAALVMLQILDPALATVEAWVRAVIVLGTSLLMLLFANRAVRGGGRALLRWRIVVAVMIVAIIVIVALPGVFPLWLRLEQAACGIILISVAALIFRRRVSE